MCQRQWSNHKCIFISSDPQRWKNVECKKIPDVVITFSRSVFGLTHTCTSPLIERRLYYMLVRFHRFSHNCSRVVYFDERSTGQMIYILVRRKKYCKCYFKVREMNGMETGAHMCTCDDKYASDNLTAAPDFLWTVALGRAKQGNEKDRDIHISRRSDRFSSLHLLLAVLDQFVSLKFARAQWQSIQPLARNKSSSSDTKMCICARTH